MVAVLLARPRSGGEVVRLRRDRLHGDARRPATRARWEWLASAALLVAVAGASADRPLHRVRSGDADRLGCGLSRRLPSGGRARRGRTLAVSRGSRRCPPEGSRTTSTRRSSRSRSRRSRNLRRRRRVHGRPRLAGRAAGRAGGARGSGRSLLRRGHHLGAGLERPRDGQRLRGARAARWRSSGGSATACGCRRRRSA